MRLLAIDPGPQQSAWCVYDTKRSRPVAWAKEPNLGVRRRIDLYHMDIEPVVLEMIASLRDGSWRRSVRDRVLDRSVR